MSPVDPVGRALGDRAGRVAAVFRQSVSDIVGFGLTAFLLLLLVIGLSGKFADVFQADQRTFALTAYRCTCVAVPFRDELIADLLHVYRGPLVRPEDLRRDTRTAVAAVGISAVLVFVLYGATVLAAAAFRVSGTPLADPQTVVPAMIASWLPPGMRGVGIAMLFTAALTTLAGVWNAMAAMVTADFALAGTRTVRGQRIAMATFALLCWLGANLLVDDILDRLILANIPVAALSFALLAGFHWPRATAAGAWASAVVGVAWGVGCFVVVGEAGGYTWPWAIYGIPLIFATGIMVSLATGDPRATQAVHT
jgi:Na+/proline symporter